MFTDKRRAMSITAEDLLNNWAKGEMTLGDDPRPLQKPACASAERHYQIPDWEEKQSRLYVNREHHFLVGVFLKGQPPIVRRIIALAYIDLRFLNDRQRNRRIARKLKMAELSVETLIDKTKAQLMVYARGHI